MTSGMDNKHNHKKYIHNNGIDNKGNHKKHIHNKMTTTTTEKT